MSRLFPYLVFMLCALCPGAALGAPVVESASAASEPGVRLQTDEFDADRVLLQFVVHENGTAVARVEYRFLFNDANQTTAFETLDRDIAADPARYLSRFESRVNESVATASATTGREMRATNSSVETETHQLPQPYGVVRYTFTWEGFAVVDDSERIVVGDALAGLYLDEESQLQITWPDGYAPESLHSGVDDEGETAAVWVGPTWFEAAGPQVVLAPDAGGFELLPSMLFVLSLLFALSGGIFWWRSGATASTAADPGGDDRGDADPTTGVADEGDTASSTAPTADASSQLPEPASPTPPTLLSNEEQVLWVLERRNGRVRQQEVVAALDWSDAKASRVIGGLRTDGRVEAFRLGNENVLRLPAESEEEEP